MTSVVHRGFTDSHCHLLPGIDDGPDRYEEALDMAEVLASSGFDRIWCTPHRITGLYDTLPETVTACAKELQQRIRQAGIQLSLLPATEYYLDDLLLSSLPTTFRLDNSMLLVEVPPSASSDVVSQVLFQAIQKGATPLIAHPERSWLLASTLDDTGSEPSLMESVRLLLPGKFGGRAVSRGREMPLFITRLAEMGCRFQGNIGSFAGIYGNTVREAALSYLKNGLYDRLGSDAHKPEGMREWLNEGLAVVRSLVGTEELSRLLRTEASRN